MGDRHTGIKDQHSSVVSGRQVTKRDISGGTRSDAGRDCRDAFLGLLKTCAKNGFEFWDYLGARLAVPGRQEIPDLAQVVRALAPTPP